MKTKILIFAAALSSLGLAQPSLAANFSSSNFFGSRFIREIQFSRCPDLLKNPQDIINRPNPLLSAELRSTLAQSPSDKEILIRLEIPTDVNGYIALTQNLFPSNRLLEVKVQSFEPFDGKFTKIIAQGTPLEIERLLTYPRFFIWGTINGYQITKADLFVPEQ